jgi:hypothetical protein
VSTLDVSLVKAFGVLLEVHRVEARGAATAFLQLLAPFVRKERHPQLYTVDKSLRLFLGLAVSTILSVEGAGFQRFSAAAPKLQPVGSASRSVK